MKRSILSSLILGSLLCQPLVALAATDSRGFALAEGFNPNLILTDGDLFDVNDMDHSRLLSFVDSKGMLADVTVKDIDGVTKSTTDVIWRVAHSYNINPKYLLALLQKEQSLVEASSAPTQRQLDWATGYGVCDDCSKDDPRIQDYKGFANQLEYAAKQMREKNYLRLLGNGQTLSGMALGKATTIDGIEVTPANFATASLYTYTPHIHGNQNLWKIWQRWFAKNFPDGTVVRGAPSGDIWWIRNGMKRQFASLSVATSMVDMNKVINISDTELASYENGAEISFPNYSLLKDPAGKIWLIVGNERRHIVNMEAFRKYGFNMDEVESATDEELAGYEIGNAVTPASAYPQGALLKDSKTKEVWYVENGDRHLITQPALLALYFKNRTAKSVTTASLEGLTRGPDYKLRDGELVKADGEPAVFVIEYGKRRPILSGEVFEELGWNWKNVVSLPGTFLSGYDLGDPVQLNAPTNAVQVASAE